MWTLERMKEYIKCSEDPVYFIETYVKAMHPEHGSVSVTLTDKQKQIVSANHSHNYVITEGERQEGVTTACVAAALHYFMFKEHKTMVFFGHKFDAAVNKLAMLKVMRESLPEWMRGEITRSTNMELVHENGNRIISKSSIDSCRGMRINYMLMDDAGFVHRLEDKLFTILPRLHKEGEYFGKVLLASTGQSVNSFSKMAHTIDQLGPMWARILT